MRKLFIAAAVAAALVQPVAATTLQTEKSNVQVDTVVTGLKHPWGMTFLPDGSMLITERNGELLRISANGTNKTAITGLPEIEAKGQGGLLDVVLSPDFATDNTLYFSFSEPGTDGSSTAVAKATLENNALTNVKVIFSQQPKVDARHHFGSRLVFDNQGNLFITMGDRGSQRAEAQNLANHIGTVARIKTDGAPASGNPFIENTTAKPEIWSFGHRNIQGAALHPQTGQLWTHEHGPQGGDEINIAQAGKNYGWPTITYGEEYGGGTIGNTQKDGLEQPLHYWVPSIAPSGMVFYGAELFSSWKDNMLVGSLKFGQLVRLELNGNKVSHEERIMIGQRIRDVEQGPDGAVYLLTDSSDGQLLRLTPAQ
uniref:PQQ-dependent oxidoreductase, gdhB family n=1 Tax=Rheinheimera sp. BAL341 TaxID=1708203 RepID=A0A486XMV8_9GAMM